ncbi:alpha-L-fucosidase, partial [Pedobacter sp. ASV12]|uniref:alpha-L-fucosidase n=1 Tax=Pedobacter sp. ASV12 TaxID=2795120 RepID=UPI00351CA4D6
MEAKTLKAPNFPVEGCSSVSYPVYAYDPNAKLHTREELILFFDKMLCANGNFLLNIGPKEDGTLLEKLVNRFAEMSQCCLLYTSDAADEPRHGGLWGGGGGVGKGG